MAQVQLCWSDEWGREFGGPHSLDGRYEEQLFSPGGGTRKPPTAETLAAGDHFFK